MQLKVLITDVDSRKGNDVANMMQNLYKREVVFTSRRDTSLQMPLVYGRKVHRLRTAHFEDFKADLQAIERAHAPSRLVYLPVSEKVSRYFYRYLEEVESTINHLLPAEETFKICADKERFQAFCEQANLPVPKAYKETDLPALIEDFRPVLIKPKQGEGSVGIRYYDTVESFERPNFNTHILQEKVVSKDKVSGAFFLCKNGQVVNAYGHKRLRTFPESGGVTVFSRSDLNEDLLGLGAKLLAALNYDGLAMVEFMFDEPSQSWRIIELNPRIWGSILLSSVNGSDMLDHYVSLVEGTSFKQVEVKQNVFIRWFFPFELLGFLKGKLSLKQLVKPASGQICYINFTHSSWRRSLLFLIYFTVNVGSIRRMIKKLGT